MDVIEYFLDKLFARLDERITASEKVIARLRSMPAGMCDEKRIARWEAKIEAYNEVADIIVSLCKLLEREDESLFKKGGRKYDRSKRK